MSPESEHPAVDNLRPSPGRALLLIARMIRLPVLRRTLPALSLPPPLARLLAPLLTVLAVCLGASTLHAASAFPLTVSDALGRDVTLRESPRRIISLTPSNTECLFALGAGSRIVGVTSFCDTPSEARAIAKVGGFAARTISIETIVALKPDLVVAGDENHRTLVEGLEHLGIPVISTKVRGFDDLFAHLLQLGAILGNEATAQARVEAMKGRIGCIRRRVAQVPLERRPRVYWEVFDEPLMSCGPRSIIGQLIETAGGVNIFGEVQEEFPQVSAEAVIARNPAIIMGPSLMRARSLTLERLRMRPGWQQIAAVRDGRLLILPDDIVARPGPRLVLGLSAIAEHLYPELFEDVRK